MNILCRFIREIARTWNLKALSWVDESRKPISTEWNIRTQKRNSIIKEGKRQVIFRDSKNESTSDKKLKNDGARMLNRIRNNLRRRKIEVWWLQKENNCSRDGFRGYKRTAI
jgi:hypothetical protein